MKREQKGCLPDGIACLAFATGWVSLVTERGGEGPFFTCPVNPRSEAPFLCGAPPSAPSVFRRKRVAPQFVSS